MKGQRACNGTGACVAGGTVNCAPYTCDSSAGACRDWCATDADCTGGRACVAGACASPSLGAKCQQNADCASGFCAAEGVCCNVACTGACVSCALPGRIGTCWPIDQGTVDPRALCSPQPASSCGQDGTCNGLGGCTLYPAGVVCAPLTCTAGMLTPPRLCDGAGTCAPAPATTSCGAAGCSTNGAGCAPG